MKPPKGNRKMKMYKDVHGNEIPSAYIHKIDRDKHSAALRISKKAQKISGQLENFKNELFQICDDLHQRALDENNVTLRANSRGGYSISTIDKSVKIEVSVSEILSFDDRIDIAQAKIQEFLRDKTQGIDQDIIMLVNSAFETRRGKLDAKRVLGLMKLKIKSPKWNEAMKLINESMQVNTTKRYARIWIRQEDGEYKSVPLDFAGL